MSEEEEEREEQERPPTWQEALARDPAYYMDTKQGQKELADMIRKESERLIEELGRTAKRNKEIIWLSRYCNSCKFFEERSGRANCRRHNVRIVKPFYGRALWYQIPSRKNELEKENVVGNIDWNKKWKEISDKVVEWAVQHVNGGFPYFCYTQPD